MRPFVLKGHKKSLTKVKYNREGDLLFTASKDFSPTVWYTENGERLGTFNGHQGVVWSVDPSPDTAYVASCSGDSTVRLWDTGSGKELCQHNTKVSARCVCFGSDSRLFVGTSDMKMGERPKLFVFSSNTASAEKTIELEDTATAATLGENSESVIVGLASGKIVRIDLRTGAKDLETAKHTQKINDIQLTPDRKAFVASSSDNTAGLFSSDTFQLWKRYNTDAPVNSAAVAPGRDEVILGGGQEAMEVTTTHTSHGNFNVQFYDLKTSRKKWEMGGHFGPVNTLQYHPAGLGYASGGEDGCVRVFFFDENYFSA
ncbi:MAG: translation initiation factor eIF3 subunit 2 [Amphiamblys sp. WSBS2006]|nr:MAG: translation initiation factor eIF3 subunit 2 [Amphiamblys sp. WSBS2006]